MNSKTETVQTTRGNGLANWRKKVAEDKERRMAELDILRQDAVTIVRDGRQFTVVTIPDKYGPRIQ
jgi:hypothetical protein